MINPPVLPITFSAKSAATPATVVPYFAPFVLVCPQNSSKLHSVAEEKRVCGDRNWVYGYKRGDKRVKAHYRKLSRPQKQSMEVVLAMVKQTVRKKERELAAQRYQQYVHACKAGQTDKGSTHRTEAIACVRDGGAGYISQYDLLWRRCWR
jgi:hypothetical protein